ncbi:hypothetical protein ACFX19_010802 [Malus domestica]
MLTQQTHNTVELNKGIVRVTFSNPGGDVIGIEYKGIDNLLEIKNLPSNRGYWDLVWKNGLDRLQGTTFKIVTLTADQIEISFNKTYDDSLGDWTLHLGIAHRSDKTCFETSRR